MVVSTPTPTPDSSTHTAFRLAEKHFKNRALKTHLPSLRQWQHLLVDHSRPPQQEDDELWRAGWWSPEHEVLPAPSRRQRVRKGKEREKDRGERPEMSCEGLKKVVLGDGKTGWIVAPGCIYIPGYLTPSDQLTLLHSSLAQYTLPPNPLSLSTHYDLPPNLFDLYSTAPETTVLPKHMTVPLLASSTSEDRSLENTSRKLNNTEPASVIGYEEIVARNKAWQGDAPSEKLGEVSVGKLMQEIRWANLGWVYQWSTKSYDFTPETPIPFPRPLADLCSAAVASVPWHEVFEGDSPETRASTGWESWPDNYEPDTGIVNFYQMNDTLMGHVDRAELDPARPLVSLSLGHAAVLLLGTASRDDTPRPLVLRSGDMLIMSGAGRQAYHGIPRIMEGTLPAHFKLSGDEPSEMRAAKKWIASARININARQVFPPGFRRPNVDV
ncbi:alkylated DNA repair protein AlkB [Cryptococcus sp. DSM 104549]